MTERRAQPIHRLVLPAPPHHPHVEGTSQTSTGCKGRLEAGTDVERGRGQVKEGLLGRRSRSRLLRPSVGAPLARPFPAGAARRPAHGASVAAAAATAARRGNGRRPVEADARPSRRRPPRPRRCARGGRGGVPRRMRATADEVHVAGGRRRRGTPADAAPRWWARPKRSRHQPTRPARHAAVVPGGVSSRSAAAAKLRPTGPSHFFLPPRALLPAVPRLGLCLSRTLPAGGGSSHPAAMHASVLPAGRAGTLSAAATRCGAPPPLSLHASLGVGRVAGGADARLALYEGEGNEAFLGGSCCRPRGHAARHGQQPPPPATPPVTPIRHALPV